MVNRQNCPCTNNVISLMLVYGGECLGGWRKKKREKAVCESINFYGVFLSHFRVDLVTLSLSEMSV